jgi:pimeloyl-ACP methyl ester carboxylesterase
MDWNPGVHVARSQKLIQKSLKVLSVVAPGAAASIGLRLFSTPRKIPRPAWEVELAKKGSSLRLSGELSAWKWGKDEAPIVLLVHGWMGRGTQLGALVEPLVAKGYQVVALDGPAHGDSPGTRTNVRFFSDALMKVLAELGEVESIVAHSFGAGATALALARGSRARSAVLVASPADLQWVIDDFCEKMEFSPRASRAFQVRLEAWAGVGIREVHIADLVRRIQAPALIVHDPEDREVPFRSAEEIAGCWPGARLLPLTKVGHRKILKAPSFISAVTSFLDGLEHQGKGHT